MLELGAAARGPDRRCFIGGSDAKIIMCGDEAALIRLWKEKRRELEPELSNNLVVQLGVVTEALNRDWYERNNGRLITDIQRWVQRRMGAALTYARRYALFTLVGIGRRGRPRRARSQLESRTCFKSRRDPKHRWGRRASKSVEYPRN
jgi:hypothetical protein